MHPSLSQLVRVGSISSSSCLSSGVQKLLRQNNYSRWITDRASAGDTGINSVQNGFLLYQPVHKLFDQFLISVNPDARHPDTLPGNMCDTDKNFIGWIQGDLFR
jgi:HNH endonuclease